MTEGNKVLRPKRGVQRDNKKIRGEINAREQGKVSYLHAETQCNKNSKDQGREQNGGGSILKILPLMEGLMRKGGGGEYGCTYRESNSQGKTLLRSKMGAGTFGRGKRVAN